MSVKKLSSRQIFGMKRESVETKIETYFKETNDAATVLEYLFALLIRNALSVSDFSGMLTAVVHQVFLQSEPTELMRWLAPFFKSYFSGGEWESVLSRLYAKKKEYHAINESVYQYKKFLFAKTTPIEEMDNQEYKIVAVFLKENGKEHTWTMRDADDKVSDEKLQVSMELLSSLTVFEQEGVRLFEKVVCATIFNCTRRIVIKKEKKPRKAAAKKVSEPAESNQNGLVESVETDQAVSYQKEQEVPVTLPSESELNGMSEEALLAYIQNQLPEGSMLTGLQLVDEEDEHEEEETDAAIKKMERVTREKSVNAAPTAVVTEDPPKQKKNKFESLYKKKKDKPKGKSQKALDDERKADLLKQSKGGKKERKKDKRKRK